MGTFRGSGEGSACRGWRIFTCTSCRRGCGSDFPNLPYPYARQLAGLAGIGLDDDWLRKVCWDNPVALFGLPETVG
jgi:hypothetical protein